jgi:hypothetical protein
MEVDLEEGIPYNIVIEARKWSYSQSIDYVNIPFRCPFCHAHGNLKASCIVDQNLDPYHDSSSKIGAMSRKSY